MVLLSPERRVFIILFTTCFFSPASPKLAVWRRVEAVAGGEAVLPCHVARAAAGDRVYVVLWYRGSSAEPLYSFDNRPGRLAGPEQRHTLRSKALEGRAIFHLNSAPALHISPVHTRDRGNFTCRADFRIAPSRRTHLTLVVVEPPDPPQLRIGGLLWPAGGMIGSLQEGGTLKVTCTVVGGDPRPAVVWRRDDEILQVSREPVAGSTQVQVSRLTVHHLTRNFHNAMLSCQAYNNNVTDPLQTYVTLSMNLRPLLTRLVSPPASLSEGRRYALSCLTAGSRPHPNVTWTLTAPATPTTYLRAETQHGVNMSSSVVYLSALRSLHGQRLVCTAVNPLFPGHPLSDSLLLNVTYPPVPSLELGRGASATVREGEDVYFNCLIQQANPPVHNVTWTRRGVPLLHSPEDGVLVGGHSLALRGVSRQAAGPYVCVASNAEGKGESPPQHLVVHYAPVCLDSEGEVHLAALGRPVNVSCHVEASPPHVKYSWIFNNSITSQRLGGRQLLGVSGGGSMVQFVASNLQDYGTLQCWAQNNVGRMTQPCLYHILPASRPERPSSCGVVNKTYDSLVVSCVAAFDGGLKQSFLASVYEAVSGRGQANLTSSRPHFTLQGLTAGVDYLILVSAHNAIGDSPTVRLEAFTYKMAANTMKEEKVLEKKEEDKHVSSLPLSSLSVVLAMAAVVVVVLVLLVGVVVAGWRWCVMGCKRDNHHTSTTTRTRTTTTTSTAATLTNKEGYSPACLPEDGDVPRVVPSVLVYTNTELLERVRLHE